MRSPSRYQTARKWLLFWCLFIGVGAVAGATGMFVAPDGSALGMQALLPYFQVLPLSGLLYQNFLFPGIALLCINGLPNLVAAWLLWKNKRAGVLAGGIFGVTLMLWICIQFVIFPFNFMSTLYFIFGLLQAVTGYAAWVFCKQETFVVHKEDYSHIGTDPRVLVVYFSRLGYTRKAAYEAAEQTGGSLYQIVAAERTQGTAGFWWCGRFGMHRWAMPIEDVTLDWASYEKVILCAPIWVFTLCGPMRSFCRQARGHIRRADYIITHFQGFSYQNAFREMDDLLQLEHENAYSLSCRTGRYKIVYKKECQR